MTEQASENSLHEGRSFRGRRKTHVLCQGTTLELAENLIFLKGTAFRPYVDALQ
jgi:hypothetical protein